MPVVNVQPDSPEWHALRMNHVGASEAWKLFDEEERERLMRRKLGLPVQDRYFDKEAAEWGKNDEPGIARKLANDNGWNIRRPPGYYTHPTVKGMGCTPDYLATMRGMPPMVLQIKAVGLTVQKKDWRDGAPQSVIIQVQQEMACTGREMAAIGARFGGNKGYVQYVPRDDDMIRDICSAIKEFWLEHEQRKRELGDGHVYAAA